MSECQCNACRERGAQEDWVSDRIRDEMQPNWREVERKADLERQFMLRAWSYCCDLDSDGDYEESQAHMQSAFMALQAAGGPRP